MDCRSRGICDYTITELTPNTEYMIYVTARRQGDTKDGPPGPTIYVKTKCDGMFCYFIYMLYPILCAMLCEKGT